MVRSHSAQHLLSKIVFDLVNFCRRRQENLKARSDAKMQKKKERREKKLLRRPGFEGRSDTLRTR